VLTGPCYSEFISMDMINVQRAAGDTVCLVDKRFAYRTAFGASSLGPVIRSPEFFLVFTQALRANVTTAPQSDNKRFFLTAFQSISHPTITDSAAKINHMLRSPVAVQTFHFVTEFSKRSLRNSCSSESTVDRTSLPFTALFPFLVT
jgi:hypothetical protein